MTSTTSTGWPPASAVVTSTGAVVWSCSVVVTAAVVSSSSVVDSRAEASLAVVSCSVTVGTMEVSSVAALVMSSAVFCSVASIVLLASVSSAVVAPVVVSSAVPVVGSTEVNRDTVTTLRSLLSLEGAEKHGKIQDSLVLLTCLMLKSTILVSRFYSLLSDGYFIFFAGIYFYQIKINANWQGQHRTGCLIIAFGRETNLNCRN